MWIQSFAAIALVWYTAVLLVIAIGTIQLYRYYAYPSQNPISSTLPLPAVPHVTIIRPVKGLEPYLYECLASTFKQSYPASKLTIYFCISSRSDPAFPILEQLIADFPGFDARVFVEEEDPNLLSQDGKENNLGPNPKIRNMSRAYREAKGDIIWIADCNVWISASVTGLMVDLLCGFNPNKKNTRKYKFVHQLPLAVDVSHLSHGTQSLAPSGGLLEEMFHSTSHAKFYTAIATAAIAPCTIGKSNMFRRSHLDALTQSHTSTQSAGIDFFSNNICEDHLISDLLWKSPLPASVLAKAELEGLEPDSDADSDSNGHQPSAQNSYGKWGHHALLPCPPCIQPLSSVSVGTYAARRTRWLRVRKFTVPVATLVEPGTECILATCLGAFSLTTPNFLLGWLGIEGVVPSTWATFGGIWAGSVVAWCMLDWRVWGMLQGWKGEDGKGEGVPEFVGSAVKREGGVRQWLGAWGGREVLAWPVWAWAVLGGTTVLWRGRRFWVGVDMRVHEVFDEKEEGKKDL
ncbi:hypothetical protein MMC10_001078 [Thelotrema lepadinum]|nr:hypothetical protein [Thelotrema lepadinum]